MRFNFRQFIYFILGGCVNTVTTWLLYILLCKTVHYQIAWFIAYFLGIVVAYCINIAIVFQGRSNIKKIMQYPFIYLLQYFFSTLLIFLFVNTEKIPNNIIPGLVAVLLVPVSFFMNRFVLEDRK